MNKKLALILMSIVTLMGCTPSTGSSSSEEIPSSLPSISSEPIENMALNLSFDEESSNTTHELVKAKDIKINYIFEDAKYTSPKVVKRYPGVSGNCLTFDGNSIYFETESIDFGDNDFAVSLFAAPRAFERNDGNYTTLISNLSSVGGFEISLTNYGKWRVVVGTSRGNYQKIITEKPLKLYKWNHIGLVYSKVNSEVKIYLDGQEIDKLSLSGGTVNNSSESVIVGRSKLPQELSVFSLNHFHGLLDEVKVFKRQLSQKEIKDLGTIAKGTKPDKDNGMWLDYELLSDDRYLPQYHMRSPSAWTNEHYGGFYYNGKYHIFSQHNPFRGYYQNGQRWGHMTSDDLVHWDVQYPALVTDDCVIDKSNAFSGAATLDKDGNPIIFYTGVNEEQYYFNSISYALPADLSDPHLVEWNKSYTKIIDQGSFASPGEFRDPFIYKENGYTYMLIGGDNGSNGAVYIYKAKDASLLNYEPLGVCYSGDSGKYPYLGTTYELPNLFKLENKSKTISKHMLMISPIRLVNGVYYWLGDFNLQTGVFTPDHEEPLKIDFGPQSQVLAASGFVDTNKNRTLFTTMSRNRMSDTEAKLSGWNGSQTLWKELYLDDNGQVCFAPIEEYDSLNKSELLNMSGISMTVGKMNNILSSIHSDQYKMEVEIDPLTDKEIGVVVKSNSNNTEEVKFTYNVSTNKFSVDNSKGSISGRNNGSGSGFITVNNKTIKFTVYVDRAMIETYLNDKNQITVFAFNDSKNSDGIRLISDGGNAVVKNIKIYELSDAYGQNKASYWGD